MNNSIHKDVFILGSTGSIGYFTREALKITQGKIYGISFYNNYTLAKQIIQSSSVQVVFCPVLGMKEQILLDFPNIKVFSTKEELTSFFAQDEKEFIVINGISGPSGLWYTQQAINSGRKILLANKESIILGGQWILNSTKSPEQIIPIDSEHFSLFVLLSCFPRSWVKSLGITASGGPFLTLPKEQFVNIKPQDALKHPIWDMGNNITLGSATLANKGLEVLEAKELFHFTMDDIEVRIHPQAQTHAMLFFHNGSWVSHQYFPSMEIPIAQALVYPEMPISLPVGEPLISEQNYSIPDLDKFPMLDLAFQVGKAHHTYQMIYTIANDIANELFLKNRISFTQIVEFVKFNLDMLETVTINNISDILYLTDTLHSKILNNQEKFI